MLSKLDLRSFVAGVITCLAAVAFFGAAAEPAAPASPNPEIGRYQMRVAATSNLFDAFVLDSVTGRVWQKGINVGARDADFFKSKVGAEANAE